MNNDETLLIQLPLGPVIVHVESWYINILVMASSLEYEIPLRVLKLDEPLKEKYKNQMPLRVLEELAPKSIRDEIIWSLYVSLD